MGNGGASGAAVDGGAVLAGAGESGTVMLGAARWARRRGWPNLMPGGWTWPTRS